MEYKAGEYYKDPNGDDIIQVLEVNKNNTGAFIVVEDPYQVWGLPEGIIHTKKSLHEYLFIGRGMTHHMPYYNTPLYKAINGDNND